jgi:two-component system OmpR family response regulator
MGVNMKPTMKTEKKRILVVDDRVSDTRLLKRYLERTNNYVVREVNDATTALSAAEEFQPHLILLDVMMPGIDGGQLAASFQVNPKLKAVPIVFVTGAVTKGEAEVRGGRSGGFTFLAKPIVLSEVVACLKRYLGPLGIQTDDLEGLMTHMKARGGPFRTRLTGDTARLVGEIPERENP